MRSKKFTAERFRQNEGLRDGSPYVRRIVVAIGRSLRTQRSKLSTASELTGANTTAAFTRPGCATSALYVTPPPIDRPSMPIRSGSTYGEVRRA
jgi:hypothetical protein